jgi:hypothetical protein
MLLGLHEKKLSAKECVPLGCVRADFYAGIYVCRQPCARFARLDASKSESEAWYFLINI